MLNEDIYVGREITVLDGSGVEDYVGGWTPDMKRLIGNTYTIIFEDTRDEGEYAFWINDEREHMWIIDSRYAEFCSEDKSMEFNSLSNLI